VLRPELVELITRFWRDPEETIRVRRNGSSTAPSRGDPKPLHRQVAAHPTASPVV